MIGVWWTGGLVDWSTHDSFAITLVNTDRPVVMVIINVEEA